MRVSVGMENSKQWKCSRKMREFIVGQDFLLKTQIENQLVKIRVGGTFGRWTEDLQWPLDGVTISAHIIQDVNMVSSEKEPLLAA